MKSKREQCCLDQEAQCILQKPRVETPGGLREGPLYLATWRFTLTMT